mgnify:CR=1
MVTTPAAKPVTSPAELIVAMVVLLLAHTPPGVAQESSDVLPAQVLAVPVIGAIEVVTVTGTYT